MAIDLFVTLSTFGAESPKPIQMLDESGFSYAINPHRRRLTAAEVIQFAAGARAVIAGVEPYDAATLAALPELRCISRCGAGMENVDLAEAARRGIAVLNTPDEPTQAVAELTLGMMLALLRRIPDTTTDLRHGKWERITGNLLTGKTVGIVGVGRIGRRVVSLVAPFNLRILACDPNADAEWAASNRVVIVDFRSLLRESDIVSLHASGTSAHPLRIGADEIASMRANSWLLNLARGTMVDDVAVAAALNRGHLAGAAFDVFPAEPYKGPLCHSPRTILSAHQATLTVETRAAMESRAVENVTRFLREHAVAR